MAIRVVHGYRALVVELAEGYVRYEVLDHEGETLLAGLADTPDDADAVILEQMALFAGHAGYAEVTLIPVLGDA